MKVECKGDTYVLNGEETSTSVADQADVAAVIARTGTQASCANSTQCHLGSDDVARHQQHLR